MKTNPPPPERPSPAFKAFVESQIQEILQISLPIRRVPEEEAGGFIWLHEICGGNPVHPKTRICVDCKRPTFSEECFKVHLTKEWMEKYPKGKSYFVSSDDVPPQPPCPTCDGCGMLPGTAPDADVMNTPCPACNPWAKSAHEKAWQKNFMVPIAQTMKQKGVAYLLILIRDDGKASYVLDTEIPPNSQLTD